MHVHYITLGVLLCLGRGADAGRAVPLVPLRAPLLTPILAPWFLRSWQPIEFSLARAPEAAPELPYEYEDDDVPKSTDGGRDENEADYDHPKGRRRGHFRVDWRDVQFDPQTAGISFTREGWTGFGIETTGTFTITPPP